MIKIQTLPFFVFLLSLFACSSVEITPVGTDLGSKDLSSQWSAADQSALKDVKSKINEATFLIGTDNLSEGKVVFDSVDHPKTGGQYLKNMKVSVIKNQNYVISMGDLGNATNMGTPEKPIMTIPFIVNFTHKNGRSNGTVMLTLWGNGRLETK